MIVVADTSPLNYLVLIGQIDILPTLYGRVSIPSVVAHELTREQTPAPVREWILSSPRWLEILDAPHHLQRVSSLDAGEREAIVLAEFVRADRVVIDEAAGRAAAQQLGLEVIGTLGVLRLASVAGLLDLSTAVRSLQEAGFYISKQVLEGVFADCK